MCKFHCPRRHICLCWFSDLFTHACAPFCCLVVIIGGSRSGGGAGGLTSRSSRSGGGSGCAGGKHVPGLSARSWQRRRALLRRGPGRRRCLRRPNASVVPCAAAHGHPSHKAIGCAQSAVPPAMRRCSPTAASAVSSKRRRCLCPLPGSRRQHGQI